MKTEISHLKNFHFIDGKLNVVNNETICGLKIHHRQIKDVGEFITCVELEEPTCDMCLKHYNTIMASIRYYSEDK
jgi:hypothetical protein